MATFSVPGWYWASRRVGSRSLAVTSINGETTRRVSCHVKEYSHFTTEQIELTISTCCPPCYSAIVQLPSNSSLQVRQIVRSPISTRYMFEYTVKSDVYSTAGHLWCHSRSGCRAAQAPYSEVEPKGKGLAHKSSDIKTSFEACRQCGVIVQLKSAIANVERTIRNLAIADPLVEADEWSTTVQHSKVQRLRSQIGVSLSQEQCADSTPLESRIYADASHKPSLKMSLVDHKPTPLYRNVSQKPVRGPQKPTLIGRPQRIHLAKARYEELNDLGSR